MEQKLHQGFAAAVAAMAICLAAGGVFAAPPGTPAKQETVIPDAQTGSLYPLLRATASRSTFDLSFLQSRFQDVEAWKREARPKVLSLLHYDPPRCDPRAEVVERVDCGVTPVLSFEEAIAHPQLAARGMLRTVEGLPQFAPPLKMSGWTFAVRHPAPKLGADDTAVLRAVGYCEADIERLRAQRVIGGGIGG